MTRWLPLAALALVVAAAPVSAGVTGKYVEARTCDVWTGPCFANAEMNLVGKNAVLAWQVESGSLDGVRLDGLGVVAVVAASDTLGLKQTGPSKAVLIVDAKATSVQREALVKLAKKQGGELTANVVAIHTAAVELNACECKENACITLQAGPARVETRCLKPECDSICGHEEAFYPPLTQGVKAKPAMVVEQTYNGKGLNATWCDTCRRGAYVGTFAVK